MAIGFKLTCKKMVQEQLIDFAGKWDSLSMTLPE